MATTLPSGRTDDRRRHARITLVGSALITPGSNAKRAFAAVLDNANRLGAGFHGKGALESNENVIVSLAFLDHGGKEQQERLSGRVAWVKPWEKGYLIGVVWDQIVTKEKNPWLYSYLDETLKEKV
jgi:hypothetical protein